VYQAAVNFRLTAVIVKYLTHHEARFFAKGAVDYSFKLIIALKKKQALGADSVNVRPGKILKRSSSALCSMYTKVTCDNLEKLHADLKHR
jgi:hypothetical protein